MITKFFYVDNCLIRPERVFSISQMKIIFPKLFVMPPKALKNRLWGRGSQTDHSQTFIPTFFYRIYQIVTGWNRKLNCLRHRNGLKKTQPGRVTSQDYHTVRWLTDCTWELQHNWLALAKLILRTLFDSTQSQESKSEVFTHEFTRQCALRHIDITLYLSSL